jgi:polysaccharide pyruvyl transferase WcaK-like protein
LVSALGRLRAWAAQWRGVPARAERIDRIAVHLDRAVAELDGRLDALDRMDADRRSDAEQLEAAAAVALSEARGRHEDVAGWTTVIDHRVAESDERLRSVAHDQRVALEASLAPARDGIAAALTAQHRHDGERRSGLSVLTITWNHAGWLAAAAASAAATLDSLGDDAGVHLILDDASTDETAAVLAGLAADPRVVVVRSPANLNLARARNVLLAACPTTHAVVLDADNRLCPDGVVAVHQVARTHGPVLAWGQVVASDDAGTTWDAFAYAPAHETLRNGLCFDSMCVVDVEALEGLGGYSTDPNLAGVVDDYELLLRCLRRDHLVTFVPVVLGRYRSAPLRHSLLSADHRRAAQRVERMYLYDEPDLERFPVAAVHPATGVLWAWEGARRRLGWQPPVPSGERPAAGGVTGPRVLVVAPGGVGNLGDDAITWAVLDRLSRTVPDARVHLVTDRNPPPQRPRRLVVPVRWDGTVLELWRGLPDELVQLAAERIGVSLDELRADTVHPAPVDLTDFELVVVAGGGNLADEFAEDVARPRLAIAAAAGALGVPVVWTGQGVGPLADDRLDLVRRVLSAAAAVSVRDEGSAELLGTTEGQPVAEVVGDDAVRPGGADPAALDDALGRAGLSPGSRFVVVHLRDAPYVTDGDEAVSTVVDAADRLAAERGVAVLALAVNDNGPGECATVRAALADRELHAEWTLLDVLDDVELAAAIAARADAVIAHSFHVALWGLASGTPAVLVAGSDYYRAKSVGLGRSFGLGESVVVAPSVDQVRLARQLDDVAAALEAGDPDRMVAAVERWLGERCRRALDGGRMPTS